jgi:predicted ATP-grasp superfamily ATP-dependent carboligase
MGFSTNLKSRLCLVLGEGVTALGAIRALRRAEIPFCVASEADSVVRQSSCYAGLPPGMRPVTRPEQLEAWLSELPEGQFFLLPCSDAWTSAVASLPPCVDGKWTSSVAGADAITTLTDKDRFRAAMEKLDLPHPRTFALDNSEAIESLPPEALEYAFLKPHNSQAFFACYGVKGIFVHDRSAAREAFQKASRAGFGMVLQEYVPGPATNHYFVDGYRPHENGVSRLLARQRLRMYPPDFGNSTDMVTIPIEDVTPAVETLDTLFSSIGYSGIFSAEFKLDERDGKFRLLEVNCRPWWYVGYADSCGLHVCQYAYQESSGQPMAPYTSYQLGRRCVYPLFDWSARKINIREGVPEQGILATLHNWVTGIQPVFSWSDPRPALGVFWRHLGDYVTKPFRRDKGEAAQ